jgi:RNA polymerase sigma-70 factor (ECF subfamily)
MTDDLRTPQHRLDCEAAQKRFDTLILPRRGLLNAVARRLTGGDRGEAEDLVQETLVRAYTHIGNVTNEGTVDAWLCTTLRHIYCNRYRTRLRSRTITDSYGDVDILQPTAEKSPALTETVVLRRHEYQLALDALAALPLMYRIPVLLADVEELTYQEIADRLNVPMGTVRSRIFRGRSRIRRRLSAWTVPN